MSNSQKEMLSVGSRIKYRREFMNIAQSDLAQKVGVSASMLSLWENNKRQLDNIDIIRRFSNALNTSVSWMIGDTFGILSGPSPNDGYPILTSLDVPDIENIVAICDDDNSFFDVDISDGFRINDSAYHLNGLPDFPAYKGSLPNIWKYLNRSENFTDCLPFASVPDFNDDLIFAYKMPDDFLSYSNDRNFNIYRDDILLFSLISKVYPGQLCIVGLASGGTLIGRFNLEHGSLHFFIENFDNDPIRIKVEFNDYNFLFRIIYSQPLGRKR